jgi:poly(3-hydroxyoctanoate) depolymerase
MFRKAVSEMHMITPNIQRHDYVGYVESQEQRVRFSIRGDGPPLLMINGVGAPLEFWRPLEERLSDFQTITVDAPGAGESSTPRGRFPMRRFAGVIDDLLTLLRVDSASVLGLSLGGLIAQDVALRNPGRVEKLVLASTTCGLGSVPVPPRVAAKVFSPLRFRSARHYRKIAPILYGERIRKDPALLDEHIEIRRRHPTSMRGYYVQLRAAATWTSRPWLHQLRMPVLVIIGSDDQLVPLRNASIIASAVPNGRLEIIEGGSHVCLLQEAARTSDLIRDFLLGA